MDYTKAPFGFRLKKAIRYLRIYGPRRTLVKIRGQYHLGRSSTHLPHRRRNRSGPGHVAIIGCGNFAFTNTAYYLTKRFGRVIRGCMDVDLNRAASLCTTYKATFYTDNADEIFDDPKIDLIYVNSNHATHAEYAIRALQSGKNVYIEKPPVVTQEQLDRLCLAWRRSQARIVGLGFNRPHSRIGKAIKQHLGKETGPAMMSWFVAGHAIDPQHWYFHPSEGGRVLGNLCHWTDFLYHMVDPEARFPVTIIPTRWEKSDCDIVVNFLFEDGTIGVITFSAKGHVFDGVREQFSAQRGNVLLSMTDFSHLLIDRLSQRQVLRSRFRDHGHEVAIINGYKLSTQAERADVEYSVTPEYLWETARLFLDTRTALETNRPVTVIGDEVCST